MQLKSIAVAAAVTAAGAAIAVSAAAPAFAGTRVTGTPSVRAAAAAHPNSCWPIDSFDADGVRIHSQPSTGSSVNGLGYNGQSVTIYGDINAPWLDIRDNATGVTGYVVTQYVLQSEFCNY